jgi:hypothetical protein
LNSEKKFTKIESYRIDCKSLTLESYIDSQVPSGGRWGVLGVAQEVEEGPILWLIVARLETIESQIDGVGTGCRLAQ